MPQLPNTLVDGWAPSKKLAKWANKRGFGDSIPLTDAELLRFKKTHPGGLHGLYLWEGEKHGIYVGISNASVTSRLRSHAKDYVLENVQSFRLFEHHGDSRELRDIERDLIHQAMKDGYLVYNSEHSSTARAHTKFDELISKNEQNTWFGDPIAANRAATDVRQPPARGADERSERKFSALTARPDADSIIDAVSLYARACIPFPLRTESDFWCVTCPGWKNKSFRRLATVNMRVLEMLWISEHLETGDVEVSMGVDHRFLPAWRTKRKLEKLGVVMDGPLHTSGGPFEEGLRFGSVDGFITAMQKSPEIRMAAARFALDRIRQGLLAGRYRDAQNTLLAEASLGRMKQWDHLSTR